jgi:hypothetical protein
MFVVDNSFRVRTFVAAFILVDAATARSREPSPLVIERAMCKTTPPRTSVSLRLGGCGSAAVRRRRETHPIEHWMHKPIYERRVFRTSSDRCVGPRFRSGCARFLRFVHDIRGVIDVQ